MPSQEMQSRLHLLFLNGKWALVTMVRLPLTNATARLVLGLRNVILHIYYLLHTFSEEKHS